MALSRRIIIKSKDSLDRLIGYCLKTGYCSFDFETTSVEYYREGEYPTVLAVCFQPGISYIIPLGHSASPFKDNYVEILQYFGKKVLENTQVVKIAWNLQFELNWCRTYSIYPKGRLFDAMIAKYLLDETRPNDLKSMVARFIPEFAGYDDEVDLLARKHGWANIPFEPLTKYAGIDADMELRLWLKFEPLLIQKGLYKLFRNLMMPALQVLSESAFNGVNINEERLLELRGIYEKETEDIIFKLTHNPRFVKYDKARKKDALKYYIAELQNEISELRDQARSDPGAARKIANREAKIQNITLGQNLTKKEEKLFEPFNFGSQTQLKDLLFLNPKGFRFKIVKYTLDQYKNSTGNPSTDEEVLEKLKLKDDSGFIELLLKHREILHIRSNFIESYLEKLYKGKLHPSFLLHGTVSGRLSSRNPNAQQVPRVATNPHIKPLFIPSPGKLIMQCITGDTLVYTDSGVKCIKDILEGDKLIHKNRLHEITRLIEQGLRPVYKLTTNTGREIKCTDNHRFKVINGFKELKGLNKGDTLFIENSIVDGPLHIDPLEAYLVGLFYGDGSYNKANGINFSTGSDRLELIPYLREYFKIEPHVNKCRETASVYVINKKIKTQWQKDYPKTNSSTMRIPERIWQASIETKKHFIGGLIDSDGSVNANRIRYSSKSKKFIDDLLVLLNSVGIYGVKAEHHRDTNYGHQDIYHIIVFSRCEIKKIQGYNRLKRKKERIDYMIDNKSFSQCKTQYIPQEVYQHIPHDNNQVYRIIKNGKRRKRITRKALENIVLSTKNPEWGLIGNYYYEVVDKVEYVGVEMVYDITVPGLSLFNGNGIVIHNCDYSQAELRVLAAMAQEKEMIRWFAEGRDIHLSSACKKYKVDYNTIKPILKDENHPEHTTWVIRRKQAKQINFGIVYGQGAKMLAGSLSSIGVEVTEEQAQKFLDDFFKEFPRIRKFIKIQHKKALKYGFVTSPFGRKRRLPEINSPNWGVKAEAQRQSVNAPIQGTASDYTLFASVLIWEKIKSGLLPLGMKQLITVHDSLIFELYPEDIHEVIRTIKPLCEYPETKEWFDFELKGITMAVDFEIGTTWGDLKNYDENIDYTTWV